MNYFFGGRGGVDSCQTMNFVLLMLLGVNRVNAAAHPELQIRGGGGERERGGRALTLDPPLECVCHLMHGSVRCIVVVVVAILCLSFFVVVVFFPNLK